MAGKKHHPQRRFTTHNTHVVVHQHHDLTMTHFLRLLTLIATVIHATVGACQSCLFDAAVYRTNIFRLNYSHNFRTGTGHVRQPTSAVFHDSALPIGILGRPSGWTLELINSPVMSYLLLRKLLTVSFHNRVRSFSRESNTIVPSTKNRNRWNGGFFVDDTNMIDPDEKVVDIPTETKGGEEEGVMTSSMIMAIGFYKKWISPILPPACRFLPTCSQYGVQAIKEYGPSRGVLLTAWRLARCSPFGGRGYDPPRWPPVAYNYGSY
jgi:putative membrane protein insertion efficiency factor